MSTADREHRDDAADTELAALKTALLELSPSPDLEDTVVAMAREAPQTHTRRPTLGRWTWMLPAAAALIVAAVLVLNGRGDTPDKPEIAVPSDGNGPLRASVVTPPSAAQVAAARDTNQPLQIDSQKGLRFGYRCEWAKGGLFEMWTDDHIAPIPRSRHRYVVDRTKGPPRHREYSYVSWPEEPGVLLMGPGAFAAVHAIIQGAGDQMAVQSSKGTWRPLAGTRFMELTLASPEPGGAETTIRAVISTAYTGTLVVDNQLARALGLHHFETGSFAALQGGASSNVFGQEALARIKIPELMLDTVLTVQVREPRAPEDGQRTILGPAPDKKPTVAPAGWIGLTGDLPDRVAFCDQLYLDENDTLVVHVDEPRESMALGLRKAQVPMSIRIETPGVHQIGLVYDAKGELPAATVFMGAVDLDPDGINTHSYKPRWITLGGNEPPGARVTIARVWRGTQALPSAEGVVVTRVCPDGKIRFPRVGIEDRMKLRMLVESKQSSSWTEVSVTHTATPPQRIGFRARADGSIVFAASTYPGGTDPRAAVDEMIKEIRWGMKVATENGLAKDPSEWMVQVWAERDAPWQSVQCILQAAAATGIRHIRHYAVGRPTVPPTRQAFVDNDLATDRALNDPPMQAPHATILVLGKPGSYRFKLRTYVRMEGKPIMVIDSPTRIMLRDVNAAEIKQHIRKELGAAARGNLAEISIIPNTLRAPHWAIQAAIEAFIEAGATQVRFGVPTLPVKSD